MNKITKILLVLVSSLSISVSAIAGELTVTGSAKANYSIGGTDKNANKGFGITNEIGLGATGELDNGFTWSYAIALDPQAAAGVAWNDDQSLAVTTPYGTVGVFITAGGLSGEHGAGIGAVGTGTDLHSTMAQKYGSDISDYQNVQYHLPAGLLPFGIGAKIGYAPNLAMTVDYAADFKSSGLQNSEEFGDSATHYQVSAAPIAGLTLQADYFETTGGNTKGQKPTAGNISAKYTMGPVSVGYRKNYSDAAITAKVGVTNYEGNAMGVQFAVNDALSLSYYVEKLERRTRANIVDTATSAVKTTAESEIKYLQAAYNIGGATIGISNADASNSEYSTTANDESTTMVTFAVAF